MYTKNIFYCLIVILTFAFNITMLGADECAVYWLHPEQPPLVISKGYGAGMGAVDRTEKFFADRLNDCTHSHDNANYERILMMMKQKENVCSVPLYRTPERDQLIEFSIPYTIVLSNALIMLESQKSKFKPLINKAGTISLE